MTIFPFSISSTDQALARLFTMNRPRPLAATVPSSTDEFEGRTGTAVMSAPRSTTPNAAPN